MGEQGKVEIATSKPCAACPWRLSNQGKPSPDGWYSKTNLRRLWSKLRRGEAMTCHPTDPSNPVSDAQKAAGYREAKPDATTRECAGAILLAQRECAVFADLCHRVDAGEEFRGGALGEYRRQRAKGLTREGLAEAVSRAAFGGMPVVGGAPVPKPNIADPEIGAPGLEGWEPAIERERERQDRRADS